MLKNWYCDQGHRNQSHCWSAPEAWRGGDGHRRSKAMDANKAMCLTDGPPACIAVAGALAISIAASVGIIMRCITLRPTKSINSRQQRMAHSHSGRPPQNATGELAIFTEYLMTKCNYWGRAILIFAQDLESITRLPAGFPFGIPSSRACTFAFRADVSP